MFRGKNRGLGIQGRSDARPRRKDSREAPDQGRQFLPVHQQNGRGGKCHQDRKGKQLFPRKWDLNYIGLPAVDKKSQNAPTLEATEIESIVAAAKERYRVLYCLLAGSGLRIAEALGLEVGKHFSADC